MYMLKLIIIECTSVLHHFFCCNIIIIYIVTLTKIIFYRILVQYCYYADINECSEESHNCDQTCSNTVGSFTCSCRSGYTLDSDGRRCNGMSI